MNDNDIIKALENRLSELCEGCTCEDEDRQTVCAGGCTFYGVKIALSVINRQNAEIEKLRKENDELKDGYFQKRYEEIEHQELMGLREAWRKSTDQNMDLQLEIERLEAEMDKQYEQAEADILGNISDGGTSCHWCIEQHRTKAIKEFAERLCDGRVSNDPVVIAVKCAVEEITEGNGK